MKDPQDSQDKWNEIWDILTSNEDFLDVFIKLDSTYDSLTLSRNIELHFYIKEHTKNRKKLALFNTTYVKD